MAEQQEYKFDNILPSLPRLKGELVVKTYLNDKIEDAKEHTYFTDFSIDKDVDNYLHTCELRSPYHPDLESYWIPGVSIVEVFGGNDRATDLLFQGRVREVNQEGYEFVMIAQNEGWKLNQFLDKQLATDGVIGKDGETIIKMLLAALKITNYTIEPGAAAQLRLVSYDEDGNLKRGGEDIEQIPNLASRIAKMDVSKISKKSSIAIELAEDKRGNIKDINAALKYREFTPTMKKVATDAGYSGASGSGTSTTGSSTVSKIKDQVFVGKPTVDNAINFLRRYFVGEFFRGTADFEYAVCVISCAEKGDHGADVQGKIGAIMGTISKNATNISDRNIRAKYLNNKPTGQKQCKVSYNNWPGI